MDRFAVLGIHDKEVESVVGEVARVRMFVGNKIVDEDFVLPELAPGTIKSEGTYITVLTPTIEARMAEIGKGLIDFTKSEINAVKTQVEQIVEVRDE